MAIKGRVLTKIPARIVGGVGTSVVLANGIYTITSSATISDGDKGDITVSASGATWTIDEDVISADARTVLVQGSLADMRIALGLGSIATQAASAVAITGGSITGITDLAVADGGTGASDAASARTNLGLVIGTNVQAFDAELAALAGLTSAADKVPYFTGSGTAALGDFTAAGRAMVGAASATAQTALLDAFTGGAKGLAPASGGGTTNFLRADGSWAAPPGGGGGTPGGSTLQLQYNNAGAFGGMAGTSWDDTNRSLTLTGATVTTSKPILDLTQTWNDSGVTFTGMKLTITDTASAAQSKYLEIVQGPATSLFSVRRDGVVMCPWGVEVGGGNITLGLSGNIGVAANSIFSWIGQVAIVPDGAGILAQRNSTNAQTLRVYNTYTDSSNYERGVFDWSKSANVLSIGAEAAGTGTGRKTIIFGSGATNRVQIGMTGHLPGFSSISALEILEPGGNVGWSFHSSNANTIDIHDSGNGAVLRLGWGSTGSLSLGWGSSGLTVSNLFQIKWSSTTLAHETVDLGFARKAASVAEFHAGTAGTSDGWFHYGGQKRVTGDVSRTSTTTLADITGLSVTVQAGRTYSFEAYLPFTCAAAGGIRAAVAGTATATDIRYDGYIVDSAADGIKGNAQAAALAGVVANAATTGTAGLVLIKGTITVNAAGTLTVQHAQSVSNGTATVVKRGAYFIVHDMP